MISDSLSQPNLALWQAGFAHGVDQISVAIDLSYAQQLLSRGDAKHHRGLAEVKICKVTGRISLIQAVTTHVLKTGFCDHQRKQLGYIWLL